MTDKPDELIQDIGSAGIKYLHYSGDGPTIIMLHATGFFPWLWHPVARDLSDNFRVMVPSLHDHRTAEPDKGISWPVLAEDLYNFCRKLNIENPIMVGHSMGGTVITLAEAFHGPLARNIILVEPIYLPRWMYTSGITLEQHPLAAKAIKRRNHWKDNEEARRYLYSRPLFRGWDEEVLNLYISRGMVPGENGGLTLACPPQTEAALFMGSVKKDPWPFLPEISCPVLVVEGEHSENREYIDLKKAASLFPEGKYQMVKNAGHLIPMEQPKTITEIIVQYAIR